MPITRQQSQPPTAAEESQAFYHLLGLFCDIKTDHPIRKVFEEDEISTVPQFISMSEEYFHDITYEEITSDDAGVETVKKVSIKKGKLAQLVWLRCFLVKEAIEENDGNQLPVDDLNRLSKSSFDSFRATHLEMPRLVMPSHPNPATSSTIALNSPAADFKKSIKRDVSHYPVLKEIKFFDKFEMELMTQARAHDIADVFNPKFKPGTHQEIDLFHEKEKFAMSVLVHCMQTDSTCTIVRCHYKKCAAQTCWNEILLDAKNSTRANLELMSLHSRLINAKLDSNWRGDVDGFLLFWNNMMARMEELQPVTQQYPWEVKKSLLVSAVNGHPALAAIYKLDQDQIIRGQKPMTFKEYFDILRSAAQQVDHEIRESGSGQHQFKRVVNYCDLSQEEYEELTTFQSTPEIAMAIKNTEIQSPIFKKPPLKSPSDPNTLYVPWELFQQLPPRVQKLVSEAKKAEPGYVPRKANFHEQVNSDDLAPDIASLSIDRSGDIIGSTSAATLDDQRLYDHIKGDAVMEAGDIRRVLAAKQRRREDEIQQQYAAKKTIVIDGVKYFANVHNVAYHVSKHYVSKQETALVDRGANGGIAGADVMVIERGVKQVTVNGINGHAIQDLPICTVAATVKSNKGPIIIIMHQYAYLGKGKSIHSSAQMEHYQNIVDDKSNRVGGKQCIKTLDGYIIPLNIQNGLVYMDMHAPSSKEYNDLPHIVLTSDVDWDPAVLDNEFVVADVQWYNAQDEYPFHDPNFNDTGQSVLVSSECNLCLSYLDTDNSSLPQVIQFQVPWKGVKFQGEHSPVAPMHTVAPNDLIGCSILLPPNEKGERYHAKIVLGQEVVTTTCVNAKPLSWFDYWMYCNRYFAVMVLLPRSPSSSRIKKFLDHMCTCAWQRGVAQSEKT